MGIGLFRLILAILVLLGHTTINTGNFHIAVSAVVCFFIVSGFLNSILIEKYYFKEKISDYYLDRFYRIGPQFYFYFLLIILLNHFLKIIDVTFLKVLLNKKSYSLPSLTMKNNKNEFIFLTNKIALNLYSTSLLKFSINL